MGASTADCVRKVEKTERENVWSPIRGTRRFASSAERMANVKQELRVGPYNKALRKGGRFVGERIGSGIIY